MDRATKNYLDAFRGEQSLDHLSDADAFELFADYCVICDAYDDEFNVVDVHTDGGQDLGVDGIATIVNGALVHVLGYFSVTFDLIIRSPCSWRQDRNSEPPGVVKDSQGGGREDQQPWN